MNVKMWITVILVVFIAGGIDLAEPAEPEEIDRT